MQRDFIGYGEHPPRANWPHKARIALNFVLNYEEGAERNVLDGDDQSENYLTDLITDPIKGGRHLSIESLFEYGSRAGVWRLMRLFEEFSIPITVFAAGLALERNPEFALKLKQSPHEIAGHGYRWINYREISKEIEKEHISRTIATIQNLTDKKVIGWYTGRKSPNTRKLIVEAGLHYDSDNYADDLPYWDKTSKTPHLIIPYCLDTNDARYTMSPGWTSGEDFFLYLKGSFDQLYREGKDSPKMMSIGLHPRISGRPGRTDALRRFIDYINTFKNVWICRRADIAEHWYKENAEQ